MAAFPIIQYMYNVPIYFQIVSDGQIIVMAEVLWQEKPQV